MTRKKKSEWFREYAKVYSENMIEFGLIPRLDVILAQS